jgi:hypothetical protein
MKKLCISKVGILIEKNGIVVVLNKSREAAVTTIALKITNIQKIVQMHI